MAKSIFEAMMTSVPNFETKRLLLRGLTIDDAKSYQKHFVDYDVVRFLSSQVPWPYPENGAAEFLKNIVLPFQGISRWSWAIRLKSNPDDIIGCVELWRPGCPDNRGFWLGKKFWGQGYMAEALEPVMEYAFNSVGFESLIFANAVGNKQSRRIKEKTGGTFIGVKPAIFVDPSFQEQELWSLTKDEWRKNRDKKTAQESK